MTAPAAKKPTAGQQASKKQVYTYQQWQADRASGLDSVPLKFAFTNERLQEIIAELKPTPDNKLVSIGAGGFILRSDMPKLDAWRNGQKKLKALMRNKEFAFSAFNYELSNHEFIITCSTEDALNALNLTKADIDKNKHLAEALAAAVKNQWKLDEERDDAEEAGIKHYTCLNCGRLCYDEKSPKRVFKSSIDAICEDCAVNFEEINGQLQRRVKQ